MSRTIAANGTNGKIFYSSFCPHCLQLAVAEEDADDSMHTQLHSLWYQRNAWWFLWPIFCLSCWRTRYANAGQIVIKLDLKKPTWVVLLFKNFHSALCECFNYGFYQHPGALFWGLAALQWFVCRVPWAGGLSLSVPLGQAGGTLRLLERILLSDLGELQLPLRNLPCLAPGSIVKQTSLWCLGIRDACRHCQNEHEPMNGKIKRQVSGYGEKGVKNHLPPVVFLFDDTHCSHWHNSCTVDTK